MDHCFVSIPIAKFNSHSLSFYLSLEINFFTSKLKNSTKKKEFCDSKNGHILAKQD